MAPEVLSPDWLKQEDVCSESTLPLLIFLLSIKPDQLVEDIAVLLHEVTNGIGKDRPPLPDESEQLKDVLLKLIKDGPGKVTGNPSVSSLDFPDRQDSLLTLSRSPLLEQVSLAYVPDTSLRKLVSM